MAYGSVPEHSTLSSRVILSSSYSVWWSQLAWGSLLGGLSTTLRRRMTNALGFMDSTGGEHGERTEHGGLVHG